jgi:hypothetical protein
MGDLYLPQRRDFLGRVASSCDTFGPPRSGILRNELGFRRRRRLSSTARGLGPSN